MTLSVPDICDDFFDEIQVLEPLFSDYGGMRKFCGEILTIRCFEDNSLVGETVRTAGHGRVVVVDGGGSLRRALLGDILAAAALEVFAGAGLVAGVDHGERQAVGTAELVEVDRGPLPLVVGGAHRLGNAH